MQFNRDGEINHYLDIVDMLKKRFEASIEKNENVVKIKITEYGIGGLIFQFEHSYWICFSENSEKFFELTSKKLENLQFPIRFALEERILEIEDR